MPGAVITITANAQIVNLYTILSGTTVANASTSNTYPGLGINHRRVSIQNDPSNGANALVFIGDGSLSTTKYAHVLSRGVVKEFNSDMGADISLNTLWVKTDTDSSKIVVGFD